MRAPVPVVVNIVVATGKLPSIMVVVKVLVWVVCFSVRTVKVSETSVEMTLDSDTTDS